MEVTDCSGNQKPSSDSVNQRPWVGKTGYVLAVLTSHFLGWLPSLAAQTPVVSMADSPGTYHVVEDCPCVVDECACQPLLLSLADKSLNELLGIQHEGITTSLTWIIDTSSVFSGGLNPGSWSNRNLLEFGIALDTEKTLYSGWQGGQIYMSFQSFRGENGNLDTGDVVVHNNIDNAFSFGQINELYLDQTLMDGKIRLKLGKVDANTEFNFNHFSGDHINSANGFITTVANMPTYPDPSTSINLFINPNERFFFGVGMYDGRLAEGVNTGHRGFDFGGPYWFAYEGGVNYGERCASRFAVGAWHHTSNQFPLFNGAGNQRGQMGYYLNWDHVLWFENPDDEEDDQGISVFGSYGWGEKEVNPVSEAFTVGVIWKGICPHQDNDVLGFGFVWSEFSDLDPSTTEDGEVHVELFYKWYVLPHLVIQPDVTHIANSGGGTGFKDPWIGTVRVILEY